MFIDEIATNTPVSITAHIGNESLEFETEVVEIDKRLRELLSDKVRILPVKLIERDNKPITFPNGIIYRIMVSDGDTPYLWTDVAIRIIQIPGTNEKVHLILSNQDAHTYNRREYYRLFLGYDGYVQVEGSRKEKQVIVRDISAMGVGLLTDKDEDSIRVGDKLHITFEDDFAKVHFDMNVNVVRIVEQDESKKVVGCQLNTYSDQINKYILTKQRERIRHGGKTVTMEKKRKRDGKY